MHTDWLAGSPSDFGGAGINCCTRLQPSVYHRLFLRYFYSAGHFRANPLIFSVAKMLIFAPELLNQESTLLPPALLYRRQLRQRVGLDTEAKPQTTVKQPAKLVRALCNSISNILNSMRSIYRRISDVISFLEAAIINSSTEPGKIQSKPKSDKRWYFAVISRKYKWLHKVQREYSRDPTCSLSKDKLWIVTHCLPSGRF